MGCSPMVGDGPWQHLAPNQAGFCQGSLCPSVSWAVINLLECEAQQCWLGLSVPAPVPGQPQPFHAQTSPSTMQGVQPWSCSCFTSPMYSPGTAQPAPWDVVPTGQFSSDCGYCQHGHRQCTPTLVRDLLWSRQKHLSSAG